MAALAVASGRSYFFGFWEVCAEEHRVIGILVMAEREEAELAEFGLAAVGDADFRGALQVQIAVVAGEDVCGQPFDLAAAFRAADGHAETVLRESVGHPRAEHVGGVHPGIMLVGHRFRAAGAVEFDFFVVEFIDRLGLRAVRQTREHAGHHQRDEPRIFRIAERFPLGVFHGFEDLFQIAGLGKLGDAVETEEFGRGRADERAKSRRRDVRQLAQHVDVLGMVGEFVIADERAIRFAAGRAELVFIELFEKLALIEFDRAVEVLEEVALGNVEHLELQLALVSLFITR